jgi:hypothetical protein
MKPIERNRRRGGRSRYRTASTDRASRPIDLPQQMVGRDMVFQAEVLEQPLRHRLPPHRLLEYRSEKAKTLEAMPLSRTDVVLTGPQSIHRYVWSSLSEWVGCGSIAARVISLPQIGHAFRTMS